MAATLPITPSAGPLPQPPPRVLTLTPFYPTHNDDAQGCFVAEPLSAIEPMGVRSRVIAVQPFYYPRQSSHPRAVSDRRRYFSLPAGLGLPLAGAFLYARVVGQVRAMHRSHPLHVVHAHSALPCGHAAALLSRELGIPFVVTVHGLDAFSTSQVPGLAGQWCNRMSKWVYRSARQVICVSEKVREQVAKAGLFRTTVLHNGVDPQLFAPRNHGSPSPTLLSVGNLIPTKGHDLLLRAFARIHQGFPGLSCNIIGDGPEAARLRALAAELQIANKVRFLGRQSRAQVAEAMQACTIFVLPSRYEGLGCVYLEAMSAGKPVIACRGQGMDDVIIHDYNGFLTEPGDLERLSATLSALLADAPRRMRTGSAARRTVLDGFTLQHQAARLASLYRECMA